MDPNRQNVRRLRIGGALLLGTVLLMCLVPSTGGIIADPPLPGPKMWRCGPFLFEPGAFFGVLGTITVLTALTVFGIVRRNICEFIGWVLFGLVIVVMCFA